MHLKNHLPKLTACCLGTVFWAFCANLLIEYSTENYLYDTLRDLPEKEAGLVLGAGKNGKYGINPYFVYRMEAAAELYFSGKVKN